MLTVRAKPFREYFQIHPAPAVADFAGVGAYYTRRRINQPFTFFFFLLAGLLYLLWRGEGLRFAAAAWFALAAFLAGHYWRARRLAQGLRLRRLAPRAGAAGREVEVRVEIRNAGDFALEELVVVDRFLGGLREVQALELNEPLAPGQVRTLSYQLRCDGGMGTQRFGPLTALVTDPFGVFEFQVIEDAPQWLRVLPSAEAIPEIPVRGSRQSFTYGPYLSPQAGASEILRGIREYHRGDSLRHICWKLSSRHQHLLVKEFERAVNAEVSLVLNMDARFHAGLKSESTWEYAKRAAASIAAQQSGKGNHVQLISQGAHVPFGRGPRHESLLLGALAEMRPGAKEETADVLDHCAALAPAGSTLIYITPAAGGMRRFGPHIDKLLKLRGLDLQVICVLIEFHTFIRKEWFNDQSPAWKWFEPAFEANMRESRDNFVAEARRRLVRSGIQAFLIKRGAALGEGFLGGGAAG